MAKSPIKNSRSPWSKIITLFKVSMTKINLKDIYSRGLRIHKNSIWCHALGWDSFIFLSVTLKKKAQTLSMIKLYASSIDTILHQSIDNYQPSGFLLS